MAQRRRYRKRAGHPIIAVRLDLDTDGFTYQKWGSEQKCKQGDWLVNNAGETYTIDATTFEQTYREVSPGLYEKSTSIWAEVAELDGAIPTKEGQSHYKAGDYVVSNNEDGSDAYCVQKDIFEAAYELDEE